MTSRCTSGFFRTGLLWFSVLVLASSCEIKFSREIITTDEKGKSTAEVSEEVCECFNKQTGDIDTRLTPCINKTLQVQTTTLPEGYDLQDSAKIANDMNSKAAASISEIMQNLVISCDAFGSEFESLYDKWYPINNSIANLDSIKILESQFQMASISDTIKKDVLNKLIRKNIEARRLDEGLRRCQQMKSLFKNEGGAYYASAFIYNLQKKYPLAINELEQQILLEHNNDIKMIIAVMKRKAQHNQ